MGSISDVCFLKKKITEYLLAVEVSMWQSKQPQSYWKRSYCRVSITEPKKKKYYL